MKSIFHDSFNNTNRSKKYINKNLTFFLFTLSLITFITLLLSACDSTEPGKETLSLTVEDISCTEVWLKLSGNVSGDFILERNNKAVNRITLSGTDNIIKDDSLQPNTTYTYKVTGNQSTSNEITTTTIDTTSHNFTWQTFTFGGEGGNSKLYDVAIIDENNIWAVGEIYTAGNKFNAVHWDGSEWELRQIQTLFKGSIITVTLEGIFAFSSTDIWMVGSLPIHGDGNNWQIYDLRTIVDPNLSLSRAWSISPGSIYFIGRNGSIAHYNRGNWEKIESGTELDLFDINSSNVEEIYVSGGNFMSYDGVVLKLSEGKCEILKEGKRLGNGNLFDPYFIGIAKTIWSSGKGIYFGGNLLYRYKHGNWELVSSFNGNYPGGNINGEHFGFISQIRGNSEQDILLVGEGNTVRHFNGSTWKQLGMEYEYSSSYTWLAVEVKEDISVIVGRSNNKAILMRLKRN